MKKPITRTLGVLVLLAVLATLVAGCSDMISSLLASTDAGVDAVALTTDTIPFTSDDTFDAVSEDFNLPITGEANGSTISWVSNNTAVITVDNETGTVTVTRPAESDADVSLTATLTDDDGNTFTKTITVTVLATTDAGDDAAALGTGDITFASGDSATAVTGDFTLPTTGEVNGSTITWVSGNTDVITIENGAATVTRPATENVDVNLTATITDADGKTSTKTIKVTIVAEGGSGDDGDGDNVYAIGATGPAGGIVFYDKGSVSDGWRYLEAAPVDIDGDSLYPWGGNDTLVGGTGTAIGTGAANTAAIVDEWGESEPENGTGDYAARMCDIYEYGGFDDWFLPSKDELDLMYGIIEGSEFFPYYWSSSEYDSELAGAAWMQDFSNGDQGFVGKSNSYHVRAVRAF